MRRAMIAMVLVLLVGSVPAGAAAGEATRVPEWAVECLPWIADWEHRPPAYRQLLEYESSHSGVYGQYCYYWSTGDARGLLTLGLSWVTAEADPGDGPQRTHCTGIGEYTHESETRGISGGIVSETHRASVSWHGDADLPEPPNEARHASAEMLLTLEEIAVPCAAATLAGDESDAGAVPASGFDAESDSGGGVPPAVILVGGAAAAAAAGVGVRRVRARRRVPSVGDLLAADQIRQGMTLGGLNPIEGAYEPPPEAARRPEKASPPPDDAAPPPPQGSFDELAREAMTAHMLEVSVQPFDLPFDPEEVAERLHEERRRRA